MLDITRARNKSNILDQSSSKGSQSRVKAKEFKMLSPFTDDEGIIRVGGRIDNALVSYETRHPALLPYDHRISRLIIEGFHIKVILAFQPRWRKQEDTGLLVHMIWPRRSVELCDMSDSQPKNRNADDGESPTAATTTPFPSIPLHLVRLLRTTDDQSWQEQDDQTLRCNFHVSKHPSSPPGSSH